jgi:membrane glycosyltransferase
MPKLAGYAEALLRPATAGVPPGRRRLDLLRAMARELVFTLLFEPVAALNKTATVLRLAVGRRRSVWAPQERRTRPVRAAEAARRFWPHTLAGVVLLVLGLAASPFAAGLLLPAVLGLLLVVPLAVLTSRPHRDDPATEPVRSFGAEPALVSRTKRLAS